MSWIVAGTGEWLQVLMWLGALGFSVLIALRLKTEDRLIAGAYLLLSAANVFIAGEEISWGQRIFWFGTPESLGAVNRQGEANLHNIVGVQAVFSLGMLAVGAYGATGPIMALRRWDAYAAWPDRARLLIPHWLLIPGFLLLAIWRLYRNLFEPPERFYVGIFRFGEVTELLLALAMLAFIWHQWRLLRSESA